MWRSFLTGLLAATAMGGCGGGGGSDPQPPGPPPPPSVAVQSGSVNRVIAGGTSVNVDITAQASNFTPTGTIYASASASDAAASFQAPVQVTANGNGNYTFSVDTTPSLAAGRYQGNLTVKLCSDPACTTAQAVPSISVPYELTVVTRNSAWVGDNLTALSPMSGAPDWSTFQGNNAHTGYVPVEVNADALRLRWKRGPVNNGGTGSYGKQLSPLVTANGMFYASGANKLNAYQEHDGSQVWSYDVSGLRWPSTNPPAVAGGVVFMAAGQQESTTMFALDAATGNVRFRAPMSGQWDSYLSPIVVDGSVFANGGTYGGLYGFTANGERIMFSSLSQTELWSPVADANTIYAYTGDAVTLFDAKSGKSISSIKDSQFSNYTYELGGSGVLGANGGLYGAAYNNGYLNGGNIGNHLTRFDTAKGFVDWRVPGVYIVTPAYSEGVLYAPNFSPYRVEARAESDGKLLWYWTPPISGERTYFSSPVVTKNLLFVSTDQNTYAINLRSRKMVWSYPAGGTLAISRNGVLYIQNAEAVVAINLK